MLTYKPVKRFFLLFALALTVQACSVKQYPLIVYEGWQPEYSLNDPDSLFKNFHGLRSTALTVYMEGEMINLIVENVNAKPNAKGFRKVRKTYSFRAKEIVADDPALPLPNRKWEERVKLNDTLYQTLFIYAYPAPDSGIQVVTANFIQDGKALRVDKMVHSVAHNGIPHYIFTDLSAGNIDFIGRELELNAVCNWTNAHSIYCPDRGRITWSRHNSSEEARSAMFIQMAQSKSYKFSKLNKEEKVNVIFEGESTVAYRLEFKPKTLRFLEKEESILIAYYLTAKVRGQFIHAVMSFHKNEAIPGGLPSLLQEVMVLPEQH